MKTILWMHLYMEYRKKKQSDKTKSVINPGNLSMKVWLSEGDGVVGQQSVKRPSGQW